MIVDFTPYWLEFLTIAGIHLVAVASPGPDFAVVVKHSVSFGRAAAIYTSIGIGLGILVHVSYSFLGLGLIIQTVPWVFTLMTYIAAAYLFYLGWGGIRSQPQFSEPNLNIVSSAPEISNKKALWIGFLTNGLNPKATVFFLTILVATVSAETPNVVKAIYGAYLALATAFWFCCLSLFLSSKAVRGYLASHGYLFDRTMGVILILLALKLIVLP